MASSDKIALWILEKLNEVGFDENDYFIGLHKFTRMLDAMSPTDEWKRIAVSKTETVVRKANNFALLTPDRMVEEPITQSSFQKWLLVNFTVYGFENGRFIGMLNLRERLTDNCPYETWKPNVPKVLNEMNSDMRFFCRRRKTGNKISQYEPPAQPPTQPSSESTMPGADSPGINFAAMDNWMVQTASKVAQECREKGQQFSFFTVRNQIEVMCIREDWKPLLRNRWNKLCKERPSRLMPIFSAAKPDEEELEYVRRQSGSESGYIPRVVLPNTRIAPSIQKLVTVTEAPGGPSSIITTEQDFKNPHLDEWMMSLGQIFSKRYGDAPFVGFKTIEEDLLHMCPREEWKHAIPFSILRLRKNPKFRQSVGAPPMSVQPKLSNTLGPSISRPPLQLRDIETPKDMNQTSGLPQKLPSVISTSAAPRSPDFNKANACSTLVTNVGGQKTNGLSTTKVPTSDHNLGGLQTRTTSTVQDNQGDLPILDAVEKESGTESTAVHDKILDSLPQLPSSVSECQSWNEMKSENLRLPTGPSSNAAEDADVSDQNVKNWILSHPNSDGYYEHSLGKQKREGKFPAAGGLLPKTLPFTGDTLSWKDLNLVSDSTPEVKQLPELTIPPFSSPPVSSFSTSPLCVSTTDKAKCPGSEEWIYQNLKNLGYDQFGWFIGLEEFKHALIDQLGWNGGDPMRAKVLDTVDELFRSGKLLCPTKTSASTSISIKPLNSLPEPVCQPSPLPGSLSDSIMEEPKSLIDLDWSDGSVSGDRESELQSSKSAVSSITTVNQVPETSWNADHPIEGPFSSDLWDLCAKEQSSNPPKSHDTVVSECASRATTGVVELDGIPKTLSHIITMSSAVSTTAQTSRQPSKRSPHFPSMNELSYLLDFTGKTTNEAEAQKAIMFTPGLFDQNSVARDLIPQYALLGMAHPRDNAIGDIDRRLYLNTNAPASFFICGLQGSGKSHTTSCILENHLLSAPELGKLEAPCSALVLNYNEYTTGSSFRACEAAYLAQASEKPGFPSLKVDHVNVLVPPSNFLRSTSLQSYSKIPNVKVRKLKLQPADLNTTAMKKLMSVDRKGSPPLYMGLVEKVLRDMGAQSADDHVDYKQFKKRIDGLDLDNLQRRPLQQRLDLLEEFLELESQERCFDFQPGSLTVVDLSCRNVDEGMACILFDICIGIYLGDGASHKGKVIAVDEAHKYMTDTPGSRMLTKTLLTVIREQRHHGTRVIISTQEPTIDTRLMDLSSATIIHRFTSPKWFDELRKHISVKGDESDEELFNRIINLRVGEALMYAPSAMVERNDGTVGKLGAEVITVGVRQRITWDGGRSVFAV